eukprot:g78625.t1
MDHELFLENFPNDSLGDGRPFKRSKFSSRDAKAEVDDDSDASDDDSSSVHGNGGKKPKLKGKGGSSCHQCKSRRNFTALTYCTSNLDKKNKKCRKKFCGHCLKKFYKENPGTIPDKTAWKCPSCRKICCCAACRRRKQKDMGGGTPEKERARPKPKKPPPQPQRSYVAPPTNTTAPPRPKFPPQFPKTAPTYQTPTQQTTTPESSSSSSSSFYETRRPSSQPSTESFYSDIQVPPVPTVVMPTSQLSSPMSTPIHAPGHTELIPEALSLVGDYDERPPVSSREYSRLLEEQMSRQAAQEDSSNPQFSRLYSIAQTPEMKKKIQIILSKKDIPKTRKKRNINDKFHSTSLSKPIWRIVVK